jgi:hypothetical protein
MSTSARLVRRLRMRLQEIERMELSGRSPSGLGMRGSHSRKSLVESVAAR